MFVDKSRNIQSFIVLFVYGFILPILRVSASSVPREYGEFKLFQTPVTYDLNTSVSIGDDNGGGKTSGYRIEAALRVESVWSDQETDFLLKFHLEAPRVFVWGAREAPAPAAWPAQSQFFARLTHGAVQAAYLDARDPLDLLNYKKSIISLFQFRAIDGETKETDISGTCDVLYESSSLTTIHKTKTGCGRSEWEQWWRRSTYSLSETLDALRGVRAEERVRLRAGHAALAARATHALRLARRPGQPARAAPPPTLQQALHDLPAHLAPTPLTMQFDSQSSEEVEELSVALSSLRELLEGGEAGEAGEDGAGAGGDLRSAHALLLALPALRGADAPRLLVLLRDRALHPLLPALCRLLGLAGAAPAHQAAADLLQLAAPDPPRALALHYLAGAALAERPAPAVRAALLQLAGSARARWLADAAALAAAAQARRADPDTQRAARDLLTKTLSRCKDEECRIARLHALGNLGLADSAESLLWHAERGARGVALAALDALGSLPAAALGDDKLRRLEALAARGGRSLEVRASAVDLFLRRAPAARLAGSARALRAAPAELRRVWWQRALLRAESDARVRDALRTLDAEDRTWHARANAGTSHVLSRDTGWALGGSDGVDGADGASGAARLESTQFAAGGLLRRGVVTLLHHDDEELAVEVWTRGLEAVAGGGRAEADDSGEPGEDGVRGGLRLRVAGLHAPGRTLFDGQAELLGHIWAGAGSAATPAARAARARTRAARLPLLAGAALSCSGGELTTFAVDAQAQVSLWSRSARAALELRVAVVSHAAAGVWAPGGARLHADARAGAAPRMQLDAHVDFYDGVTLCVRAHLHDHQHSRNLTSALSGHARGVRGWRRARSAVSERAGRTLALGRDNDQACRHLAHADA